MYRVSPFTYIVDGLLSVGLANTYVTCADNELLTFDPPSNETCSTYLSTYIDIAGGYLTEATLDATSNCEYCTVYETNVFLENLSSSYSHRWRNFGIIFAFVAFNIAAAIFLYWLARVPKGKREEKESPEEAEENKRRASLATAEKTVSHA